MNESDVIYSYTREDAIDDGILIPVDTISENLAKQAGFSIPVLVSHSLYEKHLKPTETLEKMGQDIIGRTWDVLNVARYTATQSKDSDRMEFVVSFLAVNNSNYDVKLIASIDVMSKNNQPAIHIFLPEDD